MTFGKYRVAFVDNSLPEGLIRLPSEFGSYDKVGIYRYSSNSIKDYVILDVLPVSSEDNSVYMSFKDFTTLGMEIPADIVVVFPFYKRLKAPNQIKPSILKSNQSEIHPKTSWEQIKSRNSKTIRMFMFKKGYCQPTRRYYNDDCSAYVISKPDGWKQAYPEMTDIITHINDSRSGRYTRSLIGNRISFSLSIKHIKASPEDLWWTDKQKLLSMKRQIHKSLLAHGFISEETAKKKHDIMNKEGDICNTSNERKIENWGPDRKAMRHR